MTVSTTLSTTGPMAGDGSNATWPFSFPVQSASQIQVIRRTGGTETVLASSAYSVSLVNSGRSGGVVTYPLDSTRLTSDETLTIRRSMDFLQPTNLRNQGVLAPETLEAIADRVVYMILQTREELGRTIKIGASYEAVGDLAPSDGKYLRYRLNEDSTWDIIADTVQVGSLAEQVDAAEASATAAQAAADSASVAAVSASASADTATLQAAEATRQAGLLAAEVRQSAGLPVVELNANGGVTYSHDLVSTDKFCALFRWSNDCTTINCTLNWHNVAADDGRRSIGWCRVYNQGTNALTIQAKPGTGTQAVPAPADVRGSWAGTSTDNEAQTARTFSVTIPAGTGRYVVVTAGEVNAATTSHTVSLTCSSSTSVTKSVADMGSTSSYSVSPKLNGVAWTIVLADSASAATTHTLTITTPAKAESLLWQLWAANKCSGVTFTYANVSSDATSHSITLTGVANGVCAASFHFQGNKLTDAFTGPTGTVALASDHSGTRSLRDQAIVSGYLATTGAGSVTFSTTTSAGGRQGAKIGCVFSPIAGTSSVTILGGSSVSLAAQGVAEIVALSDGVSYDIRSI